MSDVRERYARLFRRGEGTDRLQFFSDAVFAIALTLLVLDIRLPELPEEGDLLAALLALWPEVFAFALSFVIIALNWMGHHSSYRVIPRYDSGLIRLNFVVLFLVAFVPFPTSVLSDHAETPAVVLYAATVALLSLSQLAVWAYAYRRKLTTDAVDREMFRYIVLGILPAPIVFLLSIPIALIIGPVVMWGWFAIFPLSVVMARISRRSRGSASAAAR